jgi:hypothetical protein
MAARENWARSCIADARLPGSPWFAIQEHLERAVASSIAHSSGASLSALLSAPLYADANARPWQAIGERKPLVLPTHVAEGVPFEVADVVDALVLLVSAEGSEHPLSDSAAVAWPDRADPAAEARLEACLQVLGESFGRAWLGEAPRRPWLLEPPHLTLAAAEQLRVVVAAELRTLMALELKAAIRASASAPDTAATAVLAASVGRRIVEYREHAYAILDHALAAEVQRALGPSVSRRDAERVALGDGLEALLANRGSRAGEEGAIDMARLAPLRAAAVALPAGLRRLVWREALLQPAARAAGVGRASELTARAAARIARSRALSGEVPAATVLRAAARRAFHAAGLFHGALAHRAAEPAAAASQLDWLVARAYELLSAEAFAGEQPLAGGSAALAGGLSALVYAWRDLSDAATRADAPALVVMLRELRTERGLGGVANAAMAAKAVRAVARAVPAYFEELQTLAMRDERGPVRSASEASALIAETIAAEWLGKGLTATVRIEAAAWAWDQCALRGGWDFLLEVIMPLLLNLHADIRAACTRGDGWPALRERLAAPQSRWTAERLRAACCPKLDPTLSGELRKELTPAAALRAPDVTGRNTRPGKGAPTASARSAASSSAESSDEDGTSEEDGSSDDDSDSDAS